MLRMNTRADNLLNKNPYPLFKKHKDLAAHVLSPDYYSPNSVALLAIYTVVDSQVQNSGPTQSHLFE